MDALTQAEVFALIGELNGFIEKWDPRLVTQEREYQAKRTRIVAENNAEKTRREKVYKQECETLSRQSAKMLEDAQKILEDVDQMDQQLMSSDKYYSKTKTRKEAELAGVESQAYRNYTALMEGIEAIRRDYGQISKKYRESMLPFLINDLHFLFSAQRKKDYESLIVLRNTVHKFVNEVSELLPEITQDELAMKKEAFEQDQKTLALNFLSTIQEFDNQESIKNKSDETQLQRELDELFPQEFVDFLAQTGMDYESRRVKVNSGKNFADGILWMSFTDYPLLLLVENTRYLFGDTHCSDAMKKMEGPRGTAVLNEDYTENNPNVGLRVAFCNDETKKHYLKQISEKFADSPCTMQVFEGSRTVPMLDYLAARSIGIADTSTVTVHMGEKIKVDDPFELTFDRKKQHNVLICGSNDELMDRTVNLFLLSAALNRRACVYCVDGDSIVGDDRCGSFYQSLEHGAAELHTAHTRSDIVQFVHDLYEKYQQRKKKTGGDTVLFVIKNLQFLDLMQTMLLGDRVDEAEYIELPTEPKAADVLSAVVEDPTLDLLAGFSAEPTDSTVEPTGFSTKPADDDPFAALLAQVPSLTADVAPAESQNVEERDPFADLMASFSSIGADSSHVSAQPVSGAMGNASEKLQKLIADGAAYGIHFIICSSDYQTVKESMHFGMNILNKFRERIVFALSDSDAFNLIDNVNVSTLHDNTVYYTNGTTDTFQFKPYVSPAPEQVETFCSELLPM